MVKINVCIDIYKSLQEAKCRTDELNTEIMNSSQTPNYNPESALKEIARLSGKVSVYSKITGLFEVIQDWEQILEGEKDRDMLDMAKEELQEAWEELEEIQERAVNEMVPVSELDEKDCTMEIKSAAGGSESALFAEDLKGMYESFCRMNGWRWIEKAYHTDNATGKGCKYGKFEILGTGSYGMLKHEIGVHKVQRVPETEKQGRLHSSTAIVMLMPIIPQTFSIDPNDLKIETMKASGAGGQHVNTTDSACRITHIPTGIIVVNKDERDQHTNKLRAMEVIRERVYKYYAEIEMNKIQEERKSQMGQGTLGEKIRTYNWPNNRITDHRTGSQKFGISEMLGGQLLQEFIDEVKDKERTEWIELILNQNKQN